MTAVLSAASKDYTKAERKAALKVFSTAVEKAYK